jgi:hypothetical protein
MTIVTILHRTTIDTSQYFLNEPVPGAQWWP